MDTIQSIIQALLSGLDELHAGVYGAATAALGRASGDLAAAPLAIALAFALGMVHALMPGHGKTVIFSYFLGNGARLTTGIAMALRIAILHVGTAVLLLLVLGAAVVRFGRLQGAGRALETGSYAAVALIGAWLLYRALGRRDEDGRDEDGRDEDGQDEDGADGGHHHGRGGILAYAVGLLPCPLTIILMNYALVNETVPGGLLLVAVMAAGIAVTMSLIGMTAIVARKALTSSFTPSSPWFRAGTRALELLAATVIFAIGLSGLARIAT